MKKIIIGACLLMGMSAYAQETYENANLATGDLNGTARYVGMGGAMEALGADISTISTNPAGIGLFRRSQVTMTMGVNSQANAGTSAHVDGTNFSFDQVGGVYSCYLGDGSYMNLGFNYHKNRNFNGILDTSGTLSGASQNKLTALKGYLGVFDTENAYSQVDYLNEGVLGLYDSNTDDWSFAEGNRYNINKASKGHVGSWDFNISGNITDQVYLGFTAGIKSIDYDCWTLYTENLLDAGQSIGSVEMSDHRSITGSGFDMTFGAIVFPIENNPFRVGLSVATPTWYDLTTVNDTYMTNNLASQYGAYDNGSNSEEYDYKIFTPWKFGVSLGHTISNKLALGVSYEFADYKHIKSRIITEFNYPGNDVCRSENDIAMNMDTKLNLNGVSTLKLGAEYKVTPEIAVRAGYNYVSPMFKTDAYRDGTIDSPGVYYSSTTDYTNWMSTNRVTCGLGYSKGNFGFDVAYQFSSTKGEFYPFMSYYDNNTPALDCIADKVDVKNERHHVMATLTYKF